jgi:hypothetical protein
MESAVLAFALTIIRAVIKNPAKKQKLRGVLLKIRDAISLAFEE